MNDPAWGRFLAGPATLGPTPGAREAWHRGRRAYAVWILRVAEPAVEARITAVATALAAHGVRPLGEPHVTVFVAGFPTTAPVHDDDIATERLLAPLSTLGGPAPRLAVGGASAFLSCPILTVRDPHGDLERLRAPIAACSAEVRFAPYVPHLTVGTFVDARPIGPVAEALSPFRALPPLPLPADALELVTFDPADPAVRFTTLARVGFSAAARG